MVTTISNTVNLFLIPHIKMLIEEGHTVDVAFNVQQEVKPEIIEMGCKIHVLPFQRTPLNKGNLKAYKQLMKTIDNEKYDIVHTHTPVASAITRLVCKNFDSVKVFYTAHGFHFYKGAPLLNWIVYYPIEKWLARYTDTLITINKEDYDRAKSKFKSKRVEYTPGVGIDTDKFSNLNINKGSLRKEIKVPEDSFVLLSVGELNKNKNHEVVIRALHKIGNKDIHYVICGEGPLEEYLIQLTKTLKLDNQVHFLGFRNDIAQILMTSDLFVFPSYREGLSVALMEAMICELPVVCSNIRGNYDLIQHGRNGLLVNPDQVNGFSDAIFKMFTDRSIQTIFSRNNKADINKYSIKNVTYMMKKIYS
jgi:glycosyltransferase involved in cell wall biosynthesis